MGSGLAVQATLLTTSKCFEIMAGIRSFSAMSFLSSFKTICFSGFLPPPHSFGIIYVFFLLLKIRFFKNIYVLITVALPPTPLRIPAHLDEYPSSH